MEPTKKFIKDGLADFGLSDLPGRPYDNAFELLAAPTERKRLIMMGFNGSLADAELTNAQSIEKDFESPNISNLQNGIDGKWGVTHLAKRLQQIPMEFGHKWQDVIYTNVLMMCSASAISLIKEALDLNQSLEG